MSTYLFLDKEKIEIHGAFKKTPYKDGSGDQMSYGLHQIFADDGRLRTSGDINAPIPVAIAEFVTVCTHHEFVPQRANRESGLYRLGGASCELLPAQSERPCYSLRITGTNTEEMKELRAQVLGGLIHPDISFECPTSGPTRQQLLKKVDELEGELELTKDAYNTTVTELGHTKDKLAQTENDLAHTKDQLAYSEETGRIRYATILRMDKFLMELGNSMFPLIRISRVLAGMRRAIKVPPKEVSAT